MNYSELIEELGRHWGLADLQVDGEGLCSLSIDDLILTFELDAEADCFYLYSTLGAIPVEAAPDAYIKLLQANYFGSGTGNAFFAADLDTEEVYLMQRFDQQDELTFERFFELLEGFVSHLEHWRREFASGNLFNEEEPEQVAKTLEPTSPPPGSLRI